MAMSKFQRLSYLIHAHTAQPLSLNPQTAAKCALTLAAILYAPPSAAAEDAEDPAFDVTVSGQANGSARDGYRVDNTTLGPLGKLRLQDTPFSLNVVSSDFIRNTQATTTSEAVRNIPTLYTSTGSSEITPYFTLRGFSASTWTYNMAVDGMRSFDVYQPLEDKESIEVMAGATAALYGVTSPAGVVNYALKRPTQQRIRQFNVGLHDQQLWGHLDLGGRVEEVPSLSYRFNTAYATDGDVGVERQKQGRYLFSGGLAWDINKDTQLSLLASASRREVQRPQPLFMTNADIGIPDPPATNHNLGAPYGYALDSTQRAEVDFHTELAHTIQVRARARHSDILRGYSLQRQVWQNEDYDFKLRVDQNENFHTFVDQANIYVDANVETSWLKNTLTLGTGIDVFDAKDNGARSTTFEDVFSGNLGSKRAHVELPDVVPVGTSTAQKTTYNTILLSDRVSLLDKFSVLAAVTWARVDDETTSRAADGTKTTQGYDKSKVTPTLALSYTPTSYLTVYASYMQSLQQGFTASSMASNAGQVFAPFVGYQLEAGVKATLNKLLLTAAAFNISSANQYVDPTTQRASQDGRQVHRGVEVTAIGRVFKGFAVSGGFTFLDAEITKAATNQGKTPQGVPEQMARLYAEYELPPVPGLVINAAVSYTGEVPWDAANTLFVAEVATVDAGLRYQHRFQQVGTTFRLGATNLFAKDYWTTRSGILYLGTPRVVSLSCSLEI